MTKLLSDALRAVERSERRSDELVAAVEALTATIEKRTLQVEVREYTLTCSLCAWALRLTTPDAGIPKIVAAAHEAGHVKAPAPPEAAA
jgi:hypothetical protein